MGQYYKVKVNDTVYNRTINGQYTMAKLMEHSWWRNPFVNTICHEIFQTPKKVAWVGDYSDDINKELYESVYGDDVLQHDILEAQVSLNDKYLVNHTKKCYIDCNEYFDKSDMNGHGMCIHPLPILTSIGNGAGGGDYFGTCQDAVGSWCNDEISVELSPMYDKLENIVFKEDR